MNFLLILLLVHISFCVCPFPNRRSLKSLLSRPFFQRRDEQAVPPDNIMQEVEDEERSEALGMEYCDICNLMFSCGVRGVVAINRALSQGCLKQPITLNSIKAQRLEELCSEKTFKYPLVVDQSSVEFVPQIDKLGLCDVRYHLEKLDEDLLSLPYISASVQSIHDIERYSQVYQTVKRLKVADNSFTFSMLETISAMSNIEEVELTYTESCDFRPLVKYLESPENKLKDITIHIKEGSQLSDHQIDQLYAAFQSPYFHPESLVLRGLSGLKVSGLVAAVNRKISAIWIDVSSRYQAKELYELISDPRSTITSLGVSVLHDQDLEIPDPINGEALLEALTSEYNKIKRLDLGKTTRLPLKILTRILKSPNNKLIIAFTSGDTRGIQLGPNDSFEGFDFQCCFNHSNPYNKVMYQSIPYGCFLMSESMRCPRGAKGTL